MTETAVTETAATENAVTETAVTEASRRVTIEDAPRMNLLGFFLAGIIERNLADAEQLRRFERLAADVVVQAGELVVTLKFARGSLVVRRGAEAGARAGVRGSLDTLMGMALGAGMVGPVLRGALKPRGSLLLLLKLKRLLRV